jgi:hypothetical protein
MESSSSRKPKKEKAFRHIAHLCSQSSEQKGKCTDIGGCNVKDCTQAQTLLWIHIILFSVAPLSAQSSESRLLTLPAPTKSPCFCLPLSLLEEQKPKTQENTFVSVCGHRYNKSITNCTNSCATPCNANCCCYGGMK